MPVPVAGGPCTAGTFGSSCATAPSQAQAYLYQLTPGPVTRAAPIGMGSVDLITAADQISDLMFYTSKIDVPDQFWTSGFPGYPTLTEWFGVCYDGGFQVSTPGDHTFIVEQDDGVAMWIDGSFVFDVEDGIVSITGTIPNLGPNRGGAIVSIPPVYLRSGLHHVTVKYYDGWRPSLGVVIWALPPGQTFAATGCSPENSTTCATPPDTELMQLTGPPGGVINCPHR